MRQSQCANLGQWGEAIAAQYYRRKGFSVLQKNVFNRRGKRLGELDFVAVRHEHIIFVEVKTRAGREQKYGTAAEAVHYGKQLKLLRAVAWFLQAYPQYQRHQPQIDICLVEVSNLDKSHYSVIIIPNAVESRNG